MLDCCTILPAAATTQIVGAGTKPLLKSVCAITCVLPSCTVEQWTYLSALPHFELLDWEALDILAFHKKQMVERAELFSP